MTAVERCSDVSSLDLFEAMHGGELSQDLAYAFDELHEADATGSDQRNLLECCNTETEVTNCCPGPKGFTLCTNDGPNGDLCCKCINFLKQELLAFSAGVAVGGILAPEMSGLMNGYY